MEHKVSQRRETSFEEPILARRVRDSAISVTDVLSYAAVYTVGIDTVTLLGKISQDMLAGMLLDVSAIAHRSDKPLSARLITIHGRVSSEETHIDFPTPATGQVMSVPDSNLSRLLGGQTSKLQLRSIND